MDPRIAWAAPIAAAMLLAAGLASSQPADEAPAPLSPPPPPAQPVVSTVNAAPVPPPNQASQPADLTPPPVSVKPIAPPSAGNLPLAAPPAFVAPPPPKPEAPTGPPRPVRAPTAVMQALDKITAETLRFEAPVGRPIRYKTLVMTVKVCETRGSDDPLPRPAAYIVIDNQPLAAPGHALAAGKRVYEGWMFANGPALHPVQHPIYDVWLVACSAATPPT